MDTRLRETALAMAGQCTALAHRRAQADVRAMGYALVIQAHAKAPLGR
jgi:hypothetical protein